MGAIAKANSFRVSNWRREHFNDSDCSALIIIDNGANEKNRDSGESVILVALAYSELLIDAKSRIAATLV